MTDTLKPRTRQGYEDYRYMAPDWRRRIMAQLERWLMSAKRVEMTVSNEGPIFPMGDVLWVVQDKKTITLRIDNTELPINRLHHTDPECFGQDGYGHGV